jgi:hypothetical protein
MQQARALAGLPEIQSRQKLSDRVDALFRRVLGRHATKNETTSALHFIETANQETEPAGGLNTWEQFSQVLLISNEAIFLD